MEPLWDHFDTTLESLWDHFAIALGSLWGHFGVTLGSFWNHFGISFGQFLGRFFFFAGKVKKTYGANPIFLELGTFTHLVVSWGGGDFFNLP